MEVVADSLPKVHRVSSMVIRSSGLKEVLIELDALR
jgi:hypothetical protein